MAKAFAAFDLDGTLVRWQLYHALGDALAKRGLIDKQAFLGVRAARLNWKKRSGDQSFIDYEKTLIEAFDAALPNLKVEDFVAAAETVFDEYKEQVYTYTRDLIRELKARDYLLFAISGSPDVIVEKMAHFYGFDDYAATNFETRGGYFTGNKDLSVTKKPQLLRQMVKKHSLTFKNSLAVGDSESDIAMLELVERPIAFNPSKQLYSFAKNKGWPVVLERKNVIYKLSQREGSYVLGDG